ncbi:hypothetical protein BABINDRAFT_51476 [Babjeviella inositovora NRRL Y-12698]|uniref:Ubiquitin carboxyl-terminal hydrolase n=1 Tax=Babjeviella inositovora NRRL Y-12698 TaxID=984486 RepID=A0A1E3QNV0_9ASCO|nr:uncharacterized protein BABINDRAFT_51476 [Babjeviella inositovora NRRL Y-12698]ODQ78657.1 hypothetical protein BABINDRAFT_51476 [Babjeviella inositovora NRRL Y-12698]
MSTIAITIKNAGKSYPMELDLEETGLTFKNQVYSLTNIPPQRQKILVKGGQVRDDAMLSSLNLKDKQVVMVLGTPDEQLPQAPVEKTVFIEDLNADPYRTINIEEPSGLVNLGNTCYLNSTLQTLFNNEDIGQQLVSGTPTGTNAAFAGFMKTLFARMQKKEAKISPVAVLSSLRQLYPQFAERSNEGFYKQQDAEEAYSQILTVLMQQFPDLRRQFGVSFKVKSQCVDVAEEPTYSLEEDQYKLNCHITKSTNFLRDGLMDSLKETIEKNNATLGGNANYELTRTITRLPKYLNVQFVRFFWRRDTQKKSKILRKVQFPFELDLSDLLDDDIKQSKVAFRDELRKIEKTRFDETREFKKTKTLETGTPLQRQEQQQAKVKEINAKFAADFAKILPESYDLQAGENPSCLYELKAIITHQGSSADSGHYQAFVKDETDLEGDSWWRFNDDKVSAVNREKIETLCGGGESDSALILLYKGVGL